jgi:predicted metal-dependent phosphoesterase TrpH
MADDVHGPADAGANTEATVAQLTLAPADHGRFIEVPFDVPPGTEEVAVSCTVEGVPFAGKLVDLGLRDPERVRGWSGGARDCYTVRREWATPGYLPGALPPGRWAVIVASNRIPPQGCRVAVTVRCTPERLRWLKGDLHMHTVHSDGAYEPADVVRLAQAAGLDFIATTDHNTVSHNYAFPRDAQIVRIPGLELTTFGGHANLLGVAEPVSDFRVSSTADVRARFAEARQRGAKIVLNHPFHVCDSPGCHWDWGWDVDFDWYEVWNGPWRPVNLEALAWWQEQLVRGRRLVAVGGSDTHRPDPYTGHGKPTTWVWAAAATAPAILDAIGQGHVFISQLPEGPRINLRCGPFMMGDEVPAGGAGDGVPPVMVTADGLQEGDQVRVLSEQGIEQEWTAGPGETALRREWPAPPRRFYRVEVWRYAAAAGQPVMAALSNPIYFARAGA